MKETSHFISSEVSPRKAFLVFSVVLEGVCPVGRGREGGGGGGGEGWVWHYGNFSFSWLPCTVRLQPVTQGKKPRLPFHLSHHRVWSSLSQTSILSPACCSLCHQLKLLLSFSENLLIKPFLKFPSPSRQLCSSLNTRRRVAPVHLKSIGRRSFTALTPVLLNNLPASYRQAASVPCY